MSWVACAIGPAAANAMLGFKYVLPPPPVYFQHCAYCTKAPDEGQKEARCTSCGAPLREKEKVDRIL